MQNLFSSTVYDHNTDAALLDSALAGEKDALTQLLRRHQPYIYNIALKMLNNIADAEDATQEILIKIVTQLSKYDPTKSQFRTWLYRITFNHVLNMKKNKYETIVTSFDVFFDFIDKSPNIEMLENEEAEYRESMEEAKIACMAGMLMCLSREQRLTYIVGEIFEIDHRLAAEIFDITPDTFRQRLSRARKDLYEWMHNRCGLVNLNNPCRCKSKTKGFIAAGYVDPKNLKWLSSYRQRMYEISENRIVEALDEKARIYKKLYAEHPFKLSTKSTQVLEEILGNRAYVDILNLK